MTWLTTLALALTSEADLSFDDPLFVRTTVAHTPADAARVWARRGGTDVVVVAHPVASQPSSSTREAVSEMLEQPASATKFSDGVGLIPLGELGVLEVTGEQLTRTDVTEIETVARAFANRVQASNLLESIVENLPDMIFVKDAEELRFVHFNRAGEYLLGFSREEMLGKNDYDFFPEEQADFFTENDRAVLTHGDVLDIPEEIIHGAAGTRTLHTKKIPIIGSDGKPRYLLGISRDITERKLIAERLHQSQKLEAVAQLTAALAHNFNNAAMVISGYAELALRELDESETKTRGFLGKLRRASSRVSDLAARLLVFARSRVLDSIDVNVSELLHETAQMIGPLLGEEVTLDCSRIEPDCYAHVDRVQLEQVILNLALNARDAMKGAGHLAIELSRTDKTLTISVADGGCGMSPDVIDRAFEPFFSTKTTGLGSGLGLFSAREIIARHGGQIAIESAPGVGTRVSIDLPAVEAPTAADTEPEAESVIDEPALILVVEDDPEVRLVLATTLETFGYRVETADNGVSALELLERATEPIDLILSDVVMPEMGGTELIARVRSKQPDTCAILVSGYTHDAHELATDPDLLFLSKPVESERLLEAVRSLLGQG